MSFTESILGGILHEASLVGQLVLLILLIMSVASWFVIILKMMTLSRMQRQVIKDLDAFQDSRDMGQAMQSISRSSSSGIYRIAQKAVRELKRIEATKLDNRVKARLAKDNMRRALRQGINDELSAMDSKMSFLGTCANASPYLGLFGTVWGIMQSFKAIGAMKTAAITAVAPGMSEALLTTVFGLAVAIPATIFYNAIQGMIVRVETELVNFAGAFLNRIQREMPWLVTGED